MTAETNSVTVTNAAYSELAAGKDIVRLHNYGPGNARIHIGASLPAVDTDLWQVLPRGEFVLLDGLAAADNVYVRAHAEDTSIRSLAWNDNASLDPGGVLPGQLGIAVVNKTGSDITADKLVAISGFDVTAGKPKIVLADADVAAHEDIWVTIDAIANDDSGLVFKSGVSAANLNTNSASAAGDPVYLSTTAGGFAHTAPSTGNARVHPVGFVTVKSATVGEILWIIGPVRKVGTNEMQAGVPFAPIAVQQAINADGAINLTSYYTAITSVASTGQAFTLADGTVIGQLKKIGLIVDDGDATVTFNATATIVFADVGDVAELVWNGSDWIPIALYNIADGANAPAYTPA